MDYYIANRWEVAEAVLGISKFNIILSFLTVLYFLVQGSIIQNIDI